MHTLNAQMNLCDVNFALFSGVGEKHRHRQDPDVSPGKHGRHVSSDKSYEVVFVAIIIT